MSNIFCIIPSVLISSWVFPIFTNVSPERMMTVNFSRRSAPITEILSPCRELLVIKLGDRSERLEVVENRERWLEAVEGALAWLEVTEVVWTYTLNGLVGPVEEVQSWVMELVDEELWKSEICKKAGGFVGLELLFSLCLFSSILYIDVGIFLSHECVRKLSLSSLYFIRKPKRRVRTSKRLSRKPSPRGFLNLCWSPNSKLGLNSCRSRLDRRGVEVILVLIS